MNISYTFDYHDLKYLIYPVPVIIIFITMIQYPYMFFFLSEHVPVPVYHDDAVPVHVVQKVYRRFPRWEVTGQVAEGRKTHTL